MCPPGDPPDEGDETPGDDEALLAAVTSAWRPTDPRALRFHPAWHDLDEEGRLRAHDEARALRPLEAALDPDGLSTTARALLARLTRQG
jgi:hypothetical protein